MPSEDAEGIVDGDTALEGDSALGPLDHDPAVERMLQLRCEVMLFSECSMLHESDGV